MPAGQSDEGTLQDGLLFLVCQAINKISDHSCVVLLQAASDTWPVIEPNISVVYRHVF